MKTINLSFIIYYLTNTTVNVLDKAFIRTNNIQYLHKYYNNMMPSVFNTSALLYLIYKDESLCVCLCVCLLPMEFHTVGPRMLKFCMGPPLDPRQVIGYVSTPGDHP